jgi:hypothetical protein
MLTQPGGGWFPGAQGALQRTNLSGRLGRDGASGVLKRTLRWLVPPPQIAAPAAMVNCKWIHIQNSSLNLLSLLAAKIYKYSNGKANRRKKCEPKTKH